jgi:hypothetical protein
MPARLSVFAPEGPALTRTLDDGGSLLLGRAEDCDVVVPHPSVSRHHARIESDNTAWRIRDLDSKNGLRVDGSTVTESVLGDDRWFALGDVTCHWQRIGADELARRRQADTVKRALSQRLGAALRSDHGLHGLTTATLQAFLTLAECPRGFLLLRGEDGELEVRSALGLEMAMLLAPGFAGSAGAVATAMAEARPVLLSDVRLAPWLAMRPSVISGGIEALACLPLHDSGGTLLGAIYADSKEPGKHFSELDLQLLDAFARQAALLLEAAVLESEIRQVEADHTPLRWQAILSHQSAA